MRPLSLGLHAIGSTRLARTLEARHVLIARALPGAYLLQSQGDTAYDPRGAAPRPYIPSPQTIRDLARARAGVARTDVAQPRAPAPAARMTTPPTRQSVDTPPGVAEAAATWDDQRPPDATPSDQPIAGPIAETIPADEAASPPAAPRLPVVEPVAAEQPALPMTAGATSREPTRAPALGRARPFVRAVESATSPAAAPAHDIPVVRAARIDRPSSREDVTVRASNAGVSDALLTAPRDHVAPAAAERERATLPAPSRAEPVTSPARDVATGAGTDPTPSREVGEGPASVRAPDVVKAVPSPSSTVPHETLTSPSLESDGTLPRVEERRARRLPSSAPSIATTSPPGTSEPSLASPTVASQQPASALPVHEPERELFEPPARPLTAQQWLEKLRANAAPAEEPKEVPVRRPPAAVRREPPPTPAAAKSSTAMPPRVAPVKGVAPVRRAAAGGAPMPSDVPDAARALEGSTPSPVGDSARRFLRPLVGVDPASARVHRGPVANALASSYKADAIAVGDDIAIADGHDEHTPEGLGLLAHELSHVARHREPRFVPPALDAAPPASASTGGIQRAASVPSAKAASAPADDPTEEHIALSVESRVRRAAKHKQDTEEIQAPARPDPRWGGLPAPWEPLPEFGEHASAPTGSAAPRSVSRYASESHVADESHTVQRAEPGRQPSSHESEGSHGGAPSHGAHGDAQADAAANIDALARKVYDVLRRRLAAERRRGA